MSASCLPPSFFGHCPGEGGNPNSQSIFPKIELSVTHISTVVEVHVVFMIYYCIRIYSFMKIKKGSLSDLILLALEKAADEEVLGMFSYSAQMKYIKNLPNLSSVKKSTLSQAIRRLRKNGFLEQEKSHEREVVLRLTEIGRDFVGIKKEWDGRYRVVVWDIPENKRRLRDLLRRKVKEWEFKKLQKSVWVSKRNVADKLRKLILELEMEKWVVVFESDDPSLASLTSTIV